MNKRTPFAATLCLSECRGRDRIMIGKALKQEAKPFRWKEGYTSPVPEFNSPGGGYQFKTYQPIRALVDEGYLKRLPY